MTVSFPPAIPSEASLPTIKEKDRSFKWMEISLVITGIASVIILSLAGILPAYFLFTAKISLFSTFITLLLLVTLHSLQTPKEGEIKAEQEQESEDKHPIVPCVVLPVVEEGIFRGLLQSGFEMLFKKILPHILLWSLPLPTILAIGAASVLFGAAHIPNNLTWQPLTTTLSGIVNGLLYYHYGLPAAIFKHVINNTLVTTLQNIKEEKPTHEMVKV